MGLKKGMVEGVVKPRNVVFPLMKGGGEGHLTTPLTEVLIVCNYISASTMMIYPPMVLVECLSNLSMSV
jgi:hypothetical protein